MEEEHTPPGSNRRLSERFTTRSLVEVRLPTWDTLHTVYTVNLSLGGMRLSLGARVAMGAPVDIILTLPDGERLHLAGTIAHLAGTGGDVGVRFDELPQQARQQIEGYIRELAAGRTPRQRTKSIPPGTLIKKTS